MATEEEKEEIISEAEYDPSLRKLLIDNHFTFKNIVDICPPPNSKVARVSILKMDAKIQEGKGLYKTGCIFTLPGNRRDGMLYKGNIYGK